MNYTIAIASLSEIELMLNWAREEGWNPGINDPFHFQLADPTGFFIGYLDDEPVAAIANVKYSNQFSFLGLYIVKPDFRNKGLGIKIWQHALNYSGEANCGLDGVIAQQENYKKSGFKLAYRNIRYLLPRNDQPQLIDNNLIAVKKLLIYKLLEFDKQFFPTQRGTWLMPWVFNHETLVFYEGGQVKGYGTIRKCHEGYKIGPLIAENRKIADIIFAGLCTKADKSAPIYLDIPEPNSEAKSMAASLSMQPVFETARMYNKVIPEINLNKIFGVTTFELG